MDKNIKRLGHRMLALYQENEPALQEGAASNNVTCRRGCTHCCNLQIFISFPDAVAIAEQVMQSSPARVAEVTKKCFEQINLLEEDSAAYFHKNAPCVFLDDKKDCTVYDARPMPCRHYYVVSDPENCSSKDGVKEVAFLNTAHLDMQAMMESMRLMKQRNLPALLAPIPVAVLWAMRSLVEGEDAFRKTLLDEPNMGKADIRFWTGLMLERMDADPADLESIAGTEGSAGTTP